MDEGPNPTGAVPDGPSRVVIGALAVAVAVLATTIAMAAPGRVVAGETGVFEALNGLPRPAGLVLQAVMPAGTSLAALAVALVALLCRRRRAAVAVLAGWAIARVASTVLKATVGRDRPPALLTDVDLRQHLPGDGGFPSSHAAIAVAVAVAIGWAWPTARWPALAVAVLVALARCYVGVHLPLDLVGGAALGVVAGLAATAMTDRLWPAGGVATATGTEKPHTRHPHPRDA